MPTLAQPDSEINVKLFKEGNRFERERIAPAIHRAVCTKCLWTWQSQNAAEDEKAAIDRANAHAAITRHDVEVVFDLIGCHLTMVRPPSAEETQVNP